MPSTGDTSSTVAEACPDLAALWHASLNGLLTPRQVSAGSGKKIWWQCREHESHVWESSVANQKKNPRCPYCAGTKILPGYNDFATLFPAISAQFHARKNVGVSVGSLSPKSAQKVWWQCAEGHDWQATVFNRTAGRGCPTCSGRLVVTGKTDLTALFPIVAAQWHPTRNGSLQPTQVTAHTHQKVWWLCDHGHEWRATVGSRSRGNNCPFCANLLVDETNSLPALHPDIAREWHATKNLIACDQVTVASTKKAWWTCGVDDAHNWKASVADRVRGRGCPYCAGRKVLAGNNDLATLNPEVAAQWSPNNEISPREVTPGSRRKVEWQCGSDVRHVWTASVTARSRGQGCPFCCGREVLSGVNDFATLRPYLTYEWDHEENDFLPQEVPISSSKRAAWVCLANSQHRWSAFIYDRARGTQCPHCHVASVTSEGEREIASLLSLMGVQIVANTRTMLEGSLELDLYLPDYKFAIEFNGVYWHSEQFKDADYHQSKQQACARAGITLYQVWEDDWSTRRDVVMRGIAHRLGITSQLPKALPCLPAYYCERVGARSTRVVTLDYAVASSFLEEHHIQGGAIGTHYLGLVDRDDLLRAVLVLKKTGKRGELSIERYATAGIVSGGFTKLLKHAEQAHQPERWVTFADIAISDGGLYESTGFTVDETLKPDYSYAVGGRRVHKFNYRLKRFRTDPTLLHRDGMTERELAVLNGLMRVWDSGKVRYVKDLRAAVILATPVT